jgi:hypothetical protein
MIQLVYWGLDEYGEVPSAVQAKAALAKQATGLMLSQWHAHRHICENYNPHKYGILPDTRLHQAIIGLLARRNGTDCTGDRFYHWGALAGFVSLLEAGYY